MSNSAYMFDIYDKMFAEPGWKDLVEDFNKRLEELKTTLINDSKATERELHVAQGMSAIYRYVVNLEAIMESSKKQFEFAEQEKEALPAVYE